MHVRCRSGYDGSSMTSGADFSVRGLERKPVVVGYDGSENARKAVLWASRYAAVAHLPLMVVHAWIWPYFTQNLGPVAGIKDSGLRREAQRVVTEGRDLAVRSEPDLPVHQRLVIGFPSKTLTEFSREASLLVIGTRGLGGFAGLLIGSVSFHLAASADCPVMVVREARPTRDILLVGVDGSTESDQAVLFAANLALTLRKHVQLLHVQPHPKDPRPATAREEEAAVLDRAAALLKGHPEVHYTRDSVVAVSVPGEIVQWSHNAACVVLGAKGGNTLGAGLGSTAHAVLHHSRGNVVVVR